MCGILIHVYVIQRTCIVSGCTETVIRLWWNLASLITFTTVGSVVNNVMIVETASLDADHLAVVCSKWNILNIDGLFFESIKFGAWTYMNITNWRETYCDNAGIRACQCFITNGTTPRLLHDFWDGMSVPLLCFIHYWL